MLPAGLEGKVLRVHVEAEPVALDASATWVKRPSGVPDVLVSAANERNVRAVIENG